MTSRIEIIKDLRSKGASIRMIDDVAAYIGDYDSPVFVATVEFIIKIKNMLLLINVGKEQEVEVSQQVIGEAVKMTENVSFDAAKSAVGNDEDLPEDERKRVVQHIEEVEKVVETLNQTEQASDVKKKGGAKGRKSREGKKTGENSMLKRMFNISAIQEGMRRNSQRMKQMQTDQDEAQHEAAMRASRQQQRQTSQRSSQVKNSIRQRLLNAWHVAVEKQHEAESHRHDTHQPHEKHGSHESAKMHGESGRRSERMEAAKESIKESIKENLKENFKEVGKETKGREETSRNGKNSEEIGISKLIDNLVKESRAGKDDPAQNADKTTPAEKGQFAAKVEEKQGPRANEENVAKMAAETAIRNLQDTGVRLSNTEIQKMQTDRQSQVQTQTAAAQKERGIA